MRRTALVLAAVAVVVGSDPGGEAVARTNGWCGLYCDAIYVGCTKTVGWLDDDACEEWHLGCLDGCNVN
jgi:hypothetical protein